VCYSKKVLKIIAKRNCEVVKIGLKGIVVIEINNRDIRGIL